MRALWVLAVVVGCGDGARPAIDAPMTPTDGPLDGAAPAVTVTNSDGSPATSVAFSPTLVGRAATLALRVSNGGTAATGPIAISLGGGAANDYALDNQLTTCAAVSLAPAATCDVVIVFRPLATGARDAKLVVASNPGTTVMLDLHGNGVMPDLHFNPTMYAFGQLEVGQSTQTTIELKNDASVAAPIDAIAIAGNGYTLGLNTCGTSLAAGGSCDIVVKLGVGLGLLQGTLIVTSAGETYQLMLTAHGARRITVVRSGTGTGTITSLPAGINCDPDCTGLFEDAVTLTATPSATSQLASWSIPGCSNQSSTCVVPLEASAVTVTVGFNATGTSQLNVVFAGDAAGEVRVFQRTTPLTITTTCYASCSIPITPGDIVTVGATTLSTFGGLSGVCSNPADFSECEYTAVAGTSTITATFTKHPKEQWTRLLGTSEVLAVAFDTAGNVLAATSGGLFKLTSTGTTIWSRTLPVQAMVAGPGNTIYVVSGTDLKKLDGASSDIWTRPLPATAPCADPLPAQCLAVGADGAAVVSAGGAVTRWAADGTQTWTKAMTNQANGVAIDGAGIIYVAKFNTLDGIDARRFQPDGTELALFDRVGLEYHGELAVASDGTLLSTTSGHGLVRLRRTLGVGMWSDFGGYDGTFSSNVHSGISPTAIGGGAVLFYFENETGPLRHSAFGASWSFTRQQWRLHFDATISSNSGPLPRDITVSSGNQVVFGGYYQSPTYSGGYVQSFAP